MLRLPQDIGQRDRQRQRGAGVEPRARQAAPQRRRDDADRERGHVEDDQILALEADADDGAEGEPPALVAAVDEAHEDPGAGEPGERLQAIGRQQHAAGQQRRREQNAEPGERLSEAAAAEAAGEIGGQRDRRRRRQRRDEPERRQRGPEQFEGSGGDQRDQRRLVDVAEGGMQAADDEIELVAKDVVMRVGDEVDEEARRAEPQRRRAGDSRQSRGPNGVVGRCGGQASAPSSVIARAHDGRSEPGDDF